MSYMSLRQAGYEFVRKDKTNGYLLKDLNTNKLEWWFANKNHASYGIAFRGTHLEFARSANSTEVKQ